MDGAFRPSDPEGYAATAEGPRPRSISEELAKRRGLTGAQGQAAAWYGAAEKTGVKTEPLTFVELLEKKLQENARSSDMSTENVLRQMINAERPLYQQQNPLAPLLYGPGSDIPEEGRS